MRLVLILLAVLVAAPPASAARLIAEKGEDTPFRFGDADLAQTGATVGVGKEPTAMVTSPDGRRIAVLDYDSRQIRIFTRGGKLVRTLPSKRGYELFWPTRNHILVNEFDRVAAYDLASGTVRRADFRPLDITDAVQVGSRVRLLLRDALGNGPVKVADVGAAGRVRRRVTVKLPKGFDGGEGVGAAIRGHLLLVSDQDTHAIARVGEPLKKIDLPGQYYRWLSDDLVGDGLGKLARIDRKGLTVEKTVATGLPEETTVAYKGGFIVGFGRKRYDANLEVVAENPAAAEVQTPPDPLVVGDRLYGRLPNCDEGDFAGGIAIADADTGMSIKTLKGYYAFGVFGQGRVYYSEYDDDCD